MSDDSSYASFLDKANQDSTSASTKSKTQSTSKYTTTSVTASVPSSLKSLDAVYISDTDSSFEPVSLKWSPKQLPDEKQLAELIGHDAEVTVVKTRDFDPRGQYKEVIEKVEEVGDGKSQVFRVDHGRTRAEYYVISLDKDGGRVVGMKAQAVES